MDLYIVTGASRGLGWAFAERISRQPESTLLALSRSGLPEARPRTQDVRCDLASRAGQRTAAKALAHLLRAERWNKAVLINNAGTVSPVGPLENCDGADIARSLELNLLAPILLMRTFAAASGGIPKRSIINISSGAARHPYFGWAAYCTGKAGLDMASQVAALESERRGTGLHVVSLAPGVIDTAMQAEVRRKSPQVFPDVARFQQLKASGQLENPDEVAARILALEKAGALPAGTADLRDLPAGTAGASRAPRQ